MTNIGSSPRANDSTCFVRSIRLSEETIAAAAAAAAATTTTTAVAAAAARYLVRTSSSSSSATATAAAATVATNGATTTTTTTTTTTAAAAAAAAVIVVVFVVFSSTSTATSTTTAADFPYSAAITAKLGATFKIADARTEDARHPSSPALESVPTLCRGRPPSSRGLLLGWTGRGRGRGGGGRDWRPPGASQHQLILPRERIDAGGADNAANVELASLARSPPWIICFGILRLCSSRLHGRISRPESPRLSSSSYPEPRRLVAALPYPRTLHVLVRSGGPRLFIFYRPVSKRTGPRAKRPPHLTRLAQCKQNEARYREAKVCASIVEIQFIYGDNMSKSNIRKITVDPTKCNIDSRRPSVFERLGTKPAVATAAQNASDYCRNWAVNGSCSYGKNCK
jgi:hypothetical protein